MKVCLFTYLLFLTPFFSALPTFLGLDESFITSKVYEHKLSEISIKEQLNLLKVADGVTLSNVEHNKVEESSGTYVDNSKKENSTQNDGVVPQVTSQKKVYIYNTHQQEAYQDNKTVIDASIALSNQLQSAGIQVVYESNDFSAWLKNQGLDYNSSYRASYYYLNEALVNYGGFDLIIDFHRDSVPRESSYVNINGKNYAKMMFVIGGLSKNVEQVSALSNDLTARINTLQEGVIKQAMTREAYYNQEVYPNSVLIEVGSDQNTYDEISNSTNLLAQAIIQYFG
ncbi:MAG: stage II sporulation protein P [Erysipelotrichia bacterium]|nr:stage II sporulation protein P [Erysipelotrichia bacterium]NCC54574.1 stage II sporulation protein P [Erysipelotrichia bacterium]